MKSCLERNCMELLYNANSKLCDLFLGNGILSRSKNIRVYVLTDNCNVSKVKSVYRFFETSGKFFCE